MTVEGDRYALRVWSKDGLRQRAKGVIGTVLMRVFPKRAAELKQSDFTHHGRRSSLLNRLIGAGIAYRATRRGDFSDLGELHRRFWAGENAKPFHDNAQARFDAAFLRYYTPVIDELERLLDGNESITTFCELGSGSGLLLEYLAERFKRVKRLIGIDLCEATTAANRVKGGDPRLEFVAGDAVQWVRKHGEPNWVYLTHNGVLEYFAPPAVAEFLSLVADLGPATVALIEPIGRDHDLEAQTESWPYGQEFSFSHNYPHLLREVGFEIVYQHEVNVYGVRVILVLATIRGQEKHSA